MKTKVCTKCGIEKSLEDYYVRKDGEYGRFAICKKCMKEYYQENKERKRKYYQENKEKISERKRKYYQENKERKRKYYQENKEKIKERERKYYQENKEKINERNKKYNKNLYYAYLLLGIKKSQATEQEKRLVELKQIYLETYRALKNQ